ncbi:MAG: hypothetical protein D6718_06525 [Acidobacteria bacterium]|nr:MAG: hypothetical protein D6718_06525 [Acidobacteriota bacterium]
MARGSLGARLRRLIAILHRDLGYLAAGTTLLYAVSGLAVNHVRDWNPSYRVERFEERFAPIPWTGREKVVAALVRSLRLPGPPRETFRPAPERIRLFYDGFSIDADLARGIARGERPVRRPLLHFANRLHLNQAGPGWTLFADLYAVCLAFLAASGLFILKGRAGFAGRGKWLALAGLALPLGFWVFAG